MALTFALCWSISAAICGAAFAQVPAFPGAEGFGAQTTGGRGGVVVRVTNLNDSGPGSLRDAAERATGPRTVVFDVGGYIALKSVLRVGSDITIAGQTAPGDGVGLRDSEVSFSGSHNVIVRHLRIRQGLAAKQDRKSAINITGGRDMIFDHLSIQWGRWDTIDMNECTNITVQNCIIGPGVAPQRFGCLCQSENVSFIRNLWISNQSRNPKAKGRVQYVNNVVYNWGVSGYVGGHSAADHVADLISNYFIKGPNSNARFAGEFKATDHIYQTGNFADLDCDGQLNGRILTQADFNQGTDATPTLVNAPTAEPSTAVATDDAPTAFWKVTAGAGASLHRDAVDLVLIGDLLSFGKRGHTVRDPEEMGGFGELAGGKAFIDSDGDGVPDFWEIAAGSDPKTADGNIRAGSGYTRLEEYLNWMATPHAIVSQGQPLEIDLSRFTGGLPADRFTLSAAQNCTPTLLADNHTARVAFPKEFTGRARFSFASARSSALAGTVEVIVISGPH